MDEQNAGQLPVLTDDATTLPLAVAAQVDGFEVALEAPLWLFLPAVCPVESRAWIRDNRIRSLRTMTGGRWTDIPWSTADYAEVEADEQRIIASYGLPSRPPGRVWLLRPPPGVGDLERTLRVLSDDARAARVEADVTLAFRDHTARTLHALFRPHSRRFGVCAGREGCRWPVLGFGGQGRGVMSGTTNTAAAAGSGCAAGVVASFRESLAGVDVGSLSDQERVALVAELERLKGAAAACQARATDALRTSREVVAPRDVARSVGSEVALARRESPSLGDRFVGLSRALVHEMPCTMAALTDGAISERAVVEVVRETATLSLEDRGEVDRRIGPDLHRLSWRMAGRAAARVAAELDVASVIRRMEATVKSRRGTVRPAPDGMAYLTVLGPLKDVVGAHAALQKRARAVVGGQCPDETADGRSPGAIAADTALALLSGRAAGQVQPVEVQLVMTDRSLLGTGDEDRDVNEPARVPGHGSVPAPVARAWLRDAGPASTWIRRLYTSPDGRDLVAMDSRRRVFTGGLRRVLVLRDDVCTTPFCDAPIVHADHTHPARKGGPTSGVNGGGKCERCNLVKEAPGWHVAVVRGSPHATVTTTPTGHTYPGLAPPLLGWGSESHPPPEPVSELERRIDWWWHTAA